MSPRQRVFPWPWGSIVLLLSTACLSIPSLDASNTQVRIAGPEAPTYTNGIVDVRLEVTGDTPSSVELLLDGEVLATVEAPYNYPWDTTSVPEGLHRLTARSILGSAIATSEPREVVVDRTPPAVVSRTPAPGAQDVWVRGPIQAVFSEPIQPGSLTDASVRLKRDSIDISRTLSLSPDGRTLAVSPVTAFTASSSASLVLTPGIADLAGNSLTAPNEDWSWDMPYWIPWGTAQGATATGGTVQLGSYDFDSRGTLFGGWHITEGSARRLFVRKWEQGAWHPLGETLSGPAADSYIEESALGVDTNEVPIIVWSEADTLGIFQLHASQWSGTQWESVGDPSSPSDVLTHKQSPSFFRTSTGKLALTWREWKGTSASTCISTFDEPRRGWQRPFKCIATPTPDAREKNQAVLRFTQSDSPMMAWVTLGSLWTFHISQLVGQDWVEIESDITTDTQGPYISMSVDPTGNPVVAWIQSDGNAYSLYVNRWNGTQWESLGGQLDAIAGKTSVVDHSLTADDTGAPIVAWTEQGTLSGKIHLRRWHDNTWDVVDARSTPQEGLSLNGFRRTASGTLLLTGMAPSAGSQAWRLWVRQFNQ
ncbi:Ig-like domain-containing protein [Corallococcus llansteffanensis]|uniref:SbsA Ig-like domain-containing protein n=1 Tax=Corallococcus llansteffanensis TaxID=2316731 RepID=A0A3A8Q401_9BACT|nr:Ig-like domain-containing protein [Corallococcus llansteffanensis]RKH63469.1 hypothetical protein D7V93_08675 [Corallococcus llansteffanensis]